MRDYGRKWLGKQSKCSKLVKTRSKSLSNCPKMSKNVHFRRIVVRTNMITASTFYSWSVRPPVTLSSRHGQTRLRNSSKFVEINKTIQSTFFLQCSKLVKKSTELCQKDVSLFERLVNHTELIDIKIPHHRTTITRRPLPHLHEQIVVLLSFMVRCACGGSLGRERESLTCLKPVIRSVHFRQGILQS